ncbi:MAG: efflux RND transporter permease subunit [Telmatospirillum sp.]|nr:efflux RND transporter permease subunit [Telmatospirillum sp.]
MTVSDIIERHSRSIIAVASALALAGLAAAASLPVGLFPQTSFPRVVVDLNSGDRPAAETALLLTRPAEEAIRSVPGVREIRSSTSRGAAQISIDFGWGRDMVATTLQVDSALTRILPGLPAGASYDVRRMDPTVFPIISYGLISDTLSPTALRDLADLRIVPMLSSIPGLARVGVQGGQTEEIQVLADPHRLDSYGLSMTDLASALSAANVVQAVGRVQDNGKLYLMVSANALRTPDDICRVVVKSGANGLVTLGDVADVRDGVEPAWIHVSEDGKPAVLFNVYEQPDGNAVQIAGQVRDKLAAFPLPPGVKLVNWYDQSLLVVQSTGSIRDAVLIGLVLAGLVLILFLRSWRMTLIAVLVVPATLAASVLVLSMLGMSFNLMTLGGIAAAVGLVIDDVIVMVEHIARRAGTAPGDPASSGRDRVIPAAREFMQPLTGSSLATLIVFLPLGFLDGVTGAFSKALSITMAGTLALSYLMAAFVVPILARWLIDFQHWHDPAAGRQGRIDRLHTRLLDRLFKAPWLLPAALAPLLTAGWIAYSHVQTGFMPTVDEGGFVMDFYTRPGTSLTETERELSEVEDIIRSMPEVDTFSRRVGTGLGGGLGESNHGDIFVHLKPDHARPTSAVMADVLARVEKDVPGVQVELAQLMEDLIGDLTAVPQPIEIKLYAADPGQLIPQANKVADAIRQIDGVVEVKNGVTPAGDGIDLRIDAARAALEGTTPDEITRAVDIALTGTVATQLPQSAKVVGLRVRLPKALTLRRTELGDLPVRAADGHLFPLRRVASLIQVTGEAEQSRDNLAPMVAVTGRIEGRGIGAVIADVERRLTQPGLLAPGVTYEMAGLYRQQQIAFFGLAKVFAAALAAELVLMLILYERLWLSLIIVGTSLLSTTAVFIALWLTGVTLNITALMGMTMIIGIGTEMTIFYVSEYQHLCSSMPPGTALREASRNRRRPITMTTLAAILTLAPLAFAIGQGSDMQQPLAIAIIAGLVLQYPLVLLACPVLIGLTSGPRKTKIIAEHQS